MSEATSTRLRVVVAALLLTFVLSFLSGFLQDTPYNFVNYVFFFLLFIGGVGLMRATAKSTQTRPTKFFLFLTGASATLLFIFYIGYEWFRRSGNREMEGSLEGLLYLLSLDFLVGALVSLVLIRGRDPSATSQ